MSPFARVVIVAAACSLPLGGCVNFDPGDWISGEWFNTKKPLPGERKALFPEGVPGVSRGVPSDLIKGNQAAALQDQQAENPQAILPEEPKSKPKPKAKPKPKPKVAQQPTEPERRPTAVTVRPQQQPPQQQPGQQQPGQQQPGQQQVQWPDPPGQTRPAGGGGVQWPDPPAPR